MADDILIRLPVPSDIDTLLNDLRPADRDEVTAATGPDIHREITKAVCTSTIVFTAVLDGKPAAIFGVAPYAALAGIGSPWLVGTTRCDRAGRLILKYSRALMIITAREYPHLVNYVDARHVKSIRWLKWLGFTINDPAPYGFENRPFHRFEMHR